MTIERYVIFDCESTGLDKYKEAPVSISGFVLNKDLEMEEYFDEYIIPDRPIPPDAVRIHGITEELVEVLSDGKDIIDFVKEYSHIFCSNVPTVFITYNTGYDIPLFINTYNRHVKVCEENGIAKEMLPKLNLGSEITTLRGAVDLDSSRYYCLMKASTTINKSSRGRYVKLEKSLEEITSYNIESAKQTYLSFLDRNNIELKTDKLFHSSLFDSFITVLILWDNIKKFRVL